MKCNYFIKWSTYQYFCLETEINCIIKILVLPVKEQYVTCIQFFTIIVCTLILFVNKLKFAETDRMVYVGHNFGQFAKSSSLCK